MASSTTDYMTILEDLALHMPLTMLVEASELVDLLAEVLVEAVAEAVVAVAADVPADVADLAETTMVLTVPSTELVELRDGANTPSPRLDRLS